MKRYAAFIVSFVLLYIVFQILTGWILTVFYTPDLSLMNSNASQEVVFGQTSIIPFVTTLVVATLAYFFSQKLFRTK